MIVQHKLIDKPWIEIQPRWSTGPSLFDRVIHARKWLLNDLKKLESPEWPNSSDAALSDGYRSYGSRFMAALDRTIEKKK